MRERGSRKNKSSVFFLPGNVFDLSKALAHLYFLEKIRAEICSAFYLTIFSLFGTLI
jgi:hypothetical protein